MRCGLSLEWPSDEDPIAGPCSLDLPLCAAMAEMGAKGGRFGELEDLHPGFAVTIEDDHPWAPLTRACRGSAGRPRWRFEIIV
jgi:hypothetical protein